MHQDNQDRNPHALTRRVEIALRFEVPKMEATKQWLNAVVGVIKREVATDLGNSAEVTGRWL